MKKIRVRKAKPEDKKLFLKLMREHLEEIKDTPGVNLPTDRNLDSFAVIYDMYVNEEEDGVVLLVAQDAFVMAGYLGELPFDTSFGRVAHGLALYVRDKIRGQGVSQALYKRAIKLLGDMKFDTILMSLSPEETAGRKAAESAGFKQSSYIGYLYLRDKEQ